MRLLGGRKFILALLILIIATIAHIYSPTGVNASFASLLVGVLTAFGATNAYVTKKAIENGAVRNDVRGEPATLDHSPDRESIVQSRITPEIEDRLSQVELSITALASTVENMNKSLETTAKLAKAALSIKQ